MFPLSAAASGLDMPTLLFVSTSLAAFLGALLLFVWRQEPCMPALAWWGSAYLIGSAALALWNAPVTWTVPPELPGGLMFLACGMVWNGLRIFSGRRVLPVEPYLGATIWILLTALVPAFGEGQSERVALGAAMVAAYTFCIGFELRRDRRKSRRQARLRYVVPLAHATIFLLPIMLNEMFPGPSREVFGDAWFELLMIETVFYAVGTALMMLMLVKDHHVQRHKTAATTDPLTGLYNRRAFFELGADLVEYETREKQPVCVLMFDLDKFKSINDRFGHATGDDVICRFAQTLGNSMRASDIVARLGGEEFAAILQGDREVALLVAERVRANFEIAGVQFREHTIGATVSIGAACSLDFGTDIPTMIEQADRALYVSKEGGRNRATLAAPQPAHPLVHHIAAARAASRAVGAPAGAGPRVAA